MTDSYAGKTDRDLIVEMHTNINTMLVGQKIQNGKLAEHEQYIIQHKQTHEDLPGQITWNVIRKIGGISVALTGVVGLVYGILKMVHIF